MSVEYADLGCERCEVVTEHELHYAGRLLESVRQYAIEHGRVDAVDRVADGRSGAALVDGVDRFSERRTVEHGPVGTHDEAQ